MAGTDVDSRRRRGSPDHHFGQRQVIRIAPPDAEIPSGVVDRQSQRGADIPRNHIRQSPGLGFRGIDGRCSDSRIGSEYDEIPGLILETVVASPNLDRGNRYDGTEIDLPPG